MPNIRPWINTFHKYNHGMSDKPVTSEKTKVKQLPCGGWAIYGVDAKTKQLAQVGYVGASLNPDAYLPANREVVK